MSWRRITGESPCSARLRCLCVGRPGASSRASSDRSPGLRNWRLDLFDPRDGGDVMTDTSRDAAYRDQLFSFFLHEAETISQRTDWFLLFHAILFEAFAMATHERERLLFGL